MTKEQKIRTLILICIAFLCKIVQWAPTLIEHYYIPYFYRPLTKVLHFLIGWIPFSIGDIIYTVLVIIILRFLYKVFRNYKKITPTTFKKYSGKFFRAILCVYIVYSLVWGIHYNRLGIANQLSIQHGTIEKKEVVQLMKRYADSIKLIIPFIQDDREFEFPTIKKEVLIAYQNAAQSYPFLHYTFPSIKPSLYGKIMNLMGLQGYYNPLTAEAQFNKTIPAFLKPNVLLHEMAHQLIYAKEDEANFVGYLAAMHSTNPYIKYSFYMDVLLYSLPEAKLADSIAYNETKQHLPEKAKYHIQEWNAFRKRNQTFVESITQWIYNQFLTINDRSSGIYSYNEVLTLLILFEKKKP